MPPPVPFQSLSQEKLSDKIEQGLSFYPTVIKFKSLLLFPSFSSLQSRELMAPGKTWALLSLSSASSCISSVAAPCSQQKICIPHLLAHLKHSQNLLHLRLVKKKKNCFCWTCQCSFIYTPGGASISERWTNRKHLDWITSVDCVWRHVPLLPSSFLSFIFACCRWTPPRHCHSLASGWPRRTCGRADSSSSRRNELARLVGQAREHMEDL